MKTQTPKLDIRSLLENGFDEETARSLYTQGEKVVIFVLMQLAALALKTNDINGTHPSAPSASVPTFQKEPGKKRKKKSGAKSGHKGFRRPPPNITQRLEHRATHCPDCGTKLNKRNGVRKRLTEDIPANITPEVTEHTIHRDGIVEQTDEKIRTACVSPRIGCGRKHWFSPNFHPIHGGNDAKHGPSGETALQNYKLGKI